MTNARRRAAILAADVVGYSRPMGQDEAGTAKAVHEGHEASTPIVARHGGRIVKTAGDGLLVTAESVLRHARGKYPRVGPRIARTEAQGLGNVSLAFFGATDKNLTQSDSAMGVGEIAIQRQRMFTFGDALCGALGEHLDKSQPQMAKRMVRDRGQGFGQLRFGRSEGRRGIGYKGICALDRVRDRRSSERVNIVGIGGQRAFVKAARLRHIVRGGSLVEPSQTLKVEIHRVGGRGLFRASRLGGGELGVQCVRQARDDFVLHVEEICERLVEPLGPEMIARFGVDDLNIDPHAVSTALHAALEGIADVQLTADRLHVERLALVGEGGVAPDNDGIPYP